MLPIHVALVSEESSITLSELTEVAAALQKQVVRDFGPLWNVTADVSAFSDLERLPLDYWPIIVKDDINSPGAAGYHEDQHGQPFSLVQYSDDWTLTASHELLEMLGDPFGRRLVAGDSPKSDQGRVKFLVEVADPCEAMNFAYEINGIKVSDFYTPHFFDPVAAASVRYSYTGALTGPRQVLEGGYLSWFVPSLKQWWQRTWFGGDAPQDRTLGALETRNGNIRNAIDRLTAEQRLQWMRGAHTKTLAAARQSAPSSATFKERAAELRRCVQEVTGRS
jgi:hypothetical protein